MPTITPEDLRTVIALRDLPDEHLLWIIDHSEYREYADGDLVGRYGEPAEIMWFSLQGKVVFYMYINGRQVYYFTFENNDITGGVGGMMPYSRMKNYPGNSYASGELKLLRMHKKHFAALEALNPGFIQRLIGYMTERAKAFATTHLQHEKVNALGLLAAGIAHEMNNPAAAIQEISDELGKRLNRNYELTAQLLQGNITQEQLQSVRAMVEEKERSQLQQHPNMLQRLENEDRMAEWLEEHGIRERAMAETFAESGFSIEEMSSILNQTGAKSFAKLAPWLENLTSSRKMINDLANASARISQLVTSVKSHVHMDRTNELQLTHIHDDIENTLTLLGFKLREKNITVVRNYCIDMPDVPAYVSDLNQVWTNLIDNAIFVLDKDGSITIETSKGDKHVGVAIIDNGPGISPENQSRIFEPFFTTKKIGEGSGIGLDMVNRIIKKHGGTVSLVSEPGRTVFLVRLPLTQQAFPIK